MITWVVGGGGLLGTAVRQRCDALFTPSPVPWTQPELAKATLTSDASRFAEAAADKPWRIIWTAGAATVSSAEHQTDMELHALQSLLSALRKQSPLGEGSFFLTSSAGGVYAGSVDPPFSIDSIPVPKSAYGQLKLEQEVLAVEQLHDVCPVVVGRVSNLYGPGQNLAKLQGLISRLALAAVTQQAINIFVSLDTIRDYIYVDDAADAVIASTRVEASTDRKTVLIASGQPTTVGMLIRTMNQIAKRRVPVALGNHVSAVNQVLDLRLQPSTDVRSSTSLPAGMKAVYLDILERVQQTSLTV